MMAGLRRLRWIGLFLCPFRNCLLRSRGCLDHFLRFLSVLESFGLSKEIQQQVNFALPIQILAFEVVDVLKHLFDLACVVQWLVVDFPFKHKVEKFKKLSLDSLIVVLWLLFPCLLAFDFQSD